MLRLREVVCLLKTRRAVERLEEYLTPEQVYERYIEDMTVYPYLKGAERLHRRDRAVIAALYATGLRVSELLSIDKTQLDITEDWIVFKHVRLEKQKKKAKFLDKALPRRGRLAPFTLLVLDYLKHRRKPGLIFPFNRQTAYKIVKESTGQWPHYFRAQYFSYLTNETDLSTLNVKSLSGHASVSELEKYVKHDEQPYLKFKEKLLK